MVSRPIFGHGGRSHRNLHGTTRELFIVPKCARNTQVHSLFHHSYNPMGRQTDTTGKRSGAGPTILRAPPTARIIFLSDNQVISLQCPSQTRNNT